MWWYLETRKYGSCKHSGFGLGFERLVQFVTGNDQYTGCDPLPQNTGQRRILIHAQTEAQSKAQSKLSPQQIQLMKLIQLPTIALEERIQEELEINPALEEAGEQEVEDPYDTSDELNDNKEIPAEDINVDEYLSDDDIPDYRLKANNHSPDDEEKQIPLSGGETFMDHLLGQFGMRRLTHDRQRGLGEYLIGNIDDDGYIRRELIHIVDDLAFNQNVMTSEEELEEVLEVVQGLEPAGVGARDPKRMPRSSVGPAKPTSLYLHRSSHPGRSFRRIHQEALQQDHGEGGDR